jgi:AraC family transcriptional regulator, ethanolamine operon transcriptional activator
VFERTPTVRNVVAHDADEHAHNLSQWQQLYDQMAPGKFRGELTELWLEGAQMFREHTSHAVRQSCVVWPDSLWFGIPCANASSKIGAKYIGDDMIALRPGACDFELLTPDDFTILGVVIDTRLLTRHALEVEHTDPSDLLDARELLQVGSAAKQRFAGFVQRSLQVMSQPNVLLQSPAVRRSLQHALLEHVTTLLDITGPEPRQSLSQQHRQKLVTDVRHYVLDKHDEAVTVPDLCRRFYVSRRTLQNCFYEVLNTSPAAYLRSIRLNAVRRELKNPASSYQTVQDVAAAWGFWHMSQFATDYRTLFGERPSEALRSRAHL